MREQEDGKREEKEKPRKAAFWRAPTWLVTQVKPSSWPFCNGSPKVVELNYNSS